MVHVWLWQRDADVGCEFITALVQREKKRNKEKKKERKKWMNK